MTKMEMSLMGLDYETRYNILLTIPANKLDMTIDEYESEIANECFNENEELPF
jgi:hypothetical protein